MALAGNFLIFDDARPGGPKRLFCDPREEVAASRLDEVVPALRRLQSHLRENRHVAGFLAYEAGCAFDAAMVEAFRPPGGPLLWFGVFDGFQTLDEAQLDGLLGSPGGALVGPPAPRIARPDYLDAAAQVREHLFAGDFYQANLTFGCDLPLIGSPMSAYARLRRSSRGGWSGVVRHPGGWILSLSPEQFFTIRSGSLEAKPMKGTAPRRADPALDAEEAAKLTADPKQRAENLMIVDLLRNDLARVGEPGSVAVPQLFAVETYPTLHQMVSLVTARLRAGLDALDVLETIFPCGSITGAPKISAMRHLARLEPEPRGAYTGTMGWIEPNGPDRPGDAAFNVLIRTVEMLERRPARLGLGSGVVVDSIAADEWGECLLKGEFVTRAAARPDLIETMRFDPQEGVVELDRHLERLRGAADALGFRFDHHTARNELQAATFGKKEAAVARLLLSPTGKIAIEVKDAPSKPEEPVNVALRPLPVPSDDYRLRFKTSDRRFYDDARRDCGAFEVVFTDPEGFVTEGSFTSVFVERDGKLVTPPISRALLPGVLRSKLMDEGRAVETDLRPDDLASGFLVGNMARGLIAAKLA